MIEYLLHSASGCGVAFGVGLAGHLIFDVVGAAAFTYFGVRLGRRCKH